MRVAVLRTVFSWKSATSSGDRTLGDFHEVSAFSLLVRFNHTTKKLTIVFIGARTSSRRAHSYWFFRAFCSLGSGAFPDTGSTLKR